MQIPLYELFLVNNHVVTQIIKTKLVVRNICNVAVIGCASFIVLVTVQDYAYSQSEEFVYLSHPLRITLRQIVVDRYDMNTLPFECIQICRKCRNQCLTFTGTHLRDTSLMKQDTSDQLHAVMLHVKHTVCCLTDNRKCLRKQIIERLSLLQAFLKFRCLRLQLFIAQRLHRLLECLDLINDRVYLLQLFIAMCSKYFLYYAHFLPP